MLQEWGNRGIHYWEIAKLDLDLIQGQADYKFFRASADGTSATQIQMVFMECPMSLKHN